MDIFIFLLVLEDIDNILIILRDIVTIENLRGIDNAPQMTPNRGGDVGFTEARVI
jgi:hypothetical protein